MRARNLKPGIYKNYELARLGDSAFRLFTGLWGMADRQGRLKDEPEKIQAELFPFRFQKVKVDQLMHGLCMGDDPFIIRYEAKGQKYIQIVNFSEHQNPHPKEVQSSIPPCTKKFIPRLEQVTTKVLSRNAGSSDVQDLLNPGSSNSAKAPVRFIKPSAHEVKVYGTSIGFVIDGDSFCDFYESKGWKVGRTPMKDWKAAVRTWKRNGYSSPTPSTIAIPKKYVEHKPREEDIFDPSEERSLRVPV